MVQRLQTVLTAPPRSRRGVQRLTCCLGRAVETAAWLNTTKESCLSFPISTSWLLFVLPSPAIAPWGESQDRHTALGTVVLSHSHFIHLTSAAVEMLPDLWISLFLPTPCCKCHFIKASKLFQKW